ncbi:hypothetical protein P154DRAFT_527845 [Amniculicola lignicola CBS 123094]|uniref:F-box domain-containing protein n=1 Tax=Amniculicola lignicola CBS 123094 TaxID=1392246 RepID=A0A6A5VXA3_9PLEO|nr:hypothetical protein P154DRAFT_527845 [Amniculicola lignicola CBS 123094]
MQENIPLSGLQRLPQELVDKIVNKVNDRDLLALQLTCKRLQADTSFEFGRRYFTTIKFCLHPRSLHLLTVISLSPHLARHVENVVFGNEQFGLIDPVHDNDARLAFFGHTTPGPHSYDNVQKLEEARVMASASIITQALTHFPKLKLVLVGDEAHVDGSHVGHTRPTFGLHTFVCPSGHCNPKYKLDLHTVYATVALALHHLGPPDIRVGVCLPIGEYPLRTSRLCPPLRFGLRSLAQLELIFYRRDDRHITQSRDTWLQFVNPGQISKLETLHIRFEGYIALSSIKFDTFPSKCLTKFILENGVIRHERFLPFIRQNAASLTHITLSECGSKRYSVDWYPIFVEFQKLMQLNYLKLKDLVCDPSVLFRSRDAQMSHGMSLRTEWKGRTEIEVGLEYLQLTYSSVQGLPADSGFGYIGRCPSFLNLRYANFKASPMYRWTQVEEDVLWLRRINPGNRANREPADITDSPDEFPISAQPAATAEYPPSCILFEGRIWVQRPFLEASGL